MITMSNDLISRQAAINKINERQRKLIYCFGFENDMVKIMNIAKSIIIAIPPAQPEIVRCKDCKHRASYWGNCRLLEEKYHQSVLVDSDSFCSMAERRTDGVDR